MHFRWLFFGAFFWSYAVVRVCAATTFFIPEPYGLGPPYLSFSDSPFNNLQWSYFYLEDFEDGLFNTPGVDDKPYNQRGPGPGSSVDKDDGVIDGTGSGGWSYGAALPGAVFNFDGPALGGFPTHVGLVLTKAYYMGVEAYMQVWDSSGQQLPRSLSTFMQVGPIGSTADDRFFGVIHSDGISKIVLSTGIYGMTIDHLQYGKIVTIPEPSSAVVLASAVCCLAVSRRLYLKPYPKAARTPHKRLEVSRVGVRVMSRSGLASCNFPV